MSKTVHNCTMKTIIGVSKKNNSIWRIYFQDIDEYDNQLKLYTKKINPLLVWFYKLKKSKINNNIYDNCLKEFRFCKGRFEKMSDLCSECYPEKFGLS